MKEYQKVIIIIGTFLIVCTILFAGFTILRSTIRTDKNHYDTLDEIIEAHYPNSNSAIMNSDNYYYIITEKEDIVQDRLIFKNPEQKYLIFNNWHDETRNANSYFQYIRLDYNTFRSYVNVDVHDEKYIISIERYYINDKKSEENIYDNYGQWQKLEFFGRAFYFNVLEAGLVNEDYEITLKTNDRTISLIPYENLFD